MTTISVHFVELLKTHVLTVAGIKNIIPADCKIISQLVSNKTKQRVSETTIKRLYGFALSKFNPSLFTVDTLARYCGYDGWDSFCEAQNPQTKSIAKTDISWHLLKQNASKITGFTIQALKNRSGIPYNITIKRQFIDDHIDDFLESDHTATVISAPAGYGKTLAMCHWVEQKMQLSEINATNDIVLFFSSNALMSVLLCGKDINHWMLALLGYDPDQDLGALLDIQQRKAGKFYLIVDGFDEPMFKPEQFQVVLNQLVDIFSIYQSHSWFKLILSMRASSWINNRHLIEQDNGLWFTGFKADDSSCVNVPLFNISELEELGNKINPTAQNLVSVEAAQIFNHPLYFQFYYKQHRDGFSFNNVDHLCIYELTSQFIFNKIFLGQNSAEKILFIRGLTDEIDIANNHYSIDKLKVNHLLKKYQNVYQELLSIGFLREVNQSNSYQYNTSVQFVNDCYLEHSLAKNLLYHNADQFDCKLIAEVNQLYTNNAHKLQVIKWCLIHAIKTGQQDSFEKITGLKLNSNERSELVIFLGDLLDKEYSPLVKTESLTNYFSQAIGPDLFNYFFGLELIHVNYYKTLNTLLKFELSNKKRILIYTYLGIGAVVKMDMNQLNAILTALKSFPADDMQMFALNPLHCLDALYHYFKYGVIKKAIMRHLTHLYYQPQGVLAHQPNNQANDVLYLLGIYTIMLCDNGKKTLRLISFIHRNYHRDSIKEEPYHYFIQIAMADAYHKIGDADKVSAIYYALSNSYKKNDNLLTPFMKILFHCLKVKVLVNTKREGDILNELKCITAIADESGYKLSLLYIQSLLLKNYELTSKNPELQKQLHYNLTKLMRDCELNLKTAIAS